MTTLQLKTAIANYLDRSVAAMTVNGLDLALVAMNQVRLNAELLHDFNFQRQLLTLTVDSATGGSLDDAVLFGTSDTADIKTIVDLGQFDMFGNFVPQEWTTTEASLDRQREENPFVGLRYPTDGQALVGTYGRRRLTITNNTVFLFPLTEQSQSVQIGVQAYVHNADWVAEDVADEADTTDVWTTKAQQYILWASVVHLNNLFKAFVPRQEGNLPPPSALAQEGLNNFIAWDIYRYEEFRRRAS